MTILPQMTLHEYVGAIHFHTSASDGTASLDEIAKIASAVGLDFIIATDHNVLLKDKEGYYARTLVLVGEEVHDPKRVPEANHYLALDIREDVFPYASDPQAVIDATRDQGGFGFIAHPFEHSATFSGEPNLPWVDWGSQGYTGLEIWNYMSEFKTYLPDLPRTLLLAFFPRTAIRGPFPETLKKWDDLLRAGRVAAIGGSDAHAHVYRRGSLEKAIFSYEHCFKTIRTHILSREPLSGAMDHDRAIVYGALREGRCFTAYDHIGTSRGFRFTAQGAIMGESLEVGKHTELKVTSSLAAELRLIHQGEVVARTKGRTLQYRATAPGPYRVEAYRQYLLRSRGWVFTNPIYLT